MRKLRSKLFFLLLSTSLTPCIGQTYGVKPNIRVDRNGVVKSVEFSGSPSGVKGEAPTSSEVFFRDYLKPSPYDQLKNVPHKSKRKCYTHEHYDQYLNGVRVEGAGYNLHYRNGRIYFAHGHYAQTKGLSTKPSLTPEDAMKRFAGYKSIPVSAVTDYRAELIIKELTEVNNAHVQISVGNSIAYLKAFLKLTSEIELKLSQQFVGIDGLTHSIYKEYYKGFGMFLTSSRIGYAYGGFVNDYGSSGTLVKTTDGGGSWFLLSNITDQECSYYSAVVKGGASTSEQAGASLKRRTILKL